MQIFSLFNLVSTIDFTATLDLDQIIAAGDTTILNTTASTFSNLAAGASQSLTAAFDTSMIGDFASTYTFKLSDEDVPGATTQTDLVLTLLGKVVSASLLGDYNGDGFVDAADYTVWRDTLGQTVTNGSGADGSSNGTVDQDDYDVWVAHFGDHSPGRRSRLHSGSSRARHRLFIRARRLSHRVARPTAHDQILITASSRMRRTAAFTLVLSVAAFAYPAVVSAQILRVAAYNVDADTPTGGGPTAGPGLDTVLGAIGNVGTSPATRSLSMCWQSKNRTAIPR